MLGFQYPLKRMLFFALIMDLSIDLDQKDLLTIILSLNFFHILNVAYKLILFYFTNMV